MFIKLPLLLTVVFSLTLSSIQAAELDDIEKMLSRRVIDDKLSLEEVQVFTERQVPPMPDVQSIEEWEKHANRMRRETLAKVVFRGEAAKWRDASYGVKWVGTISGGPEYTIKKLLFEAAPGMWIPALMYEPKNLTGKVPVVLNVNGHDRPNGKAAAYKQIRCINQAKRGMIALNVEWVGMGQLNTPGFVHYKMNQLNLCGTSGLAPFYLSMSRGLDILLNHPHADKNRVAVAGLSGGGWQTIFISALDERVTLSDPVAGYSSFKTRARFLTDLGDSEQTPCDMATVTDYAQLTAMRAPRPTLLTFNAKDNCCFASGHALAPLLEAARPIFKLYGKQDSLSSHVNTDPGTHNFDRDNREALYRMFGAHFYPNDAKFYPEEIDCKGELKSIADLHIELPKTNQDFHSLALTLAKDLPREKNIPTEKAALQDWKKSQRTALKQIVRARDYTVSKAEKSGEEFNGKTSATFWQLKIGNDWTVPATELVNKKSGGKRGTVILLADSGRKSVSRETADLLGKGYRVVAVDPFYFGESKIASRDFLFALMVSTVGDRPLGLQASQVSAVATWLKDKRGFGSVTVKSIGKRSSLYGLVAAGLNPAAIETIEMTGSLKSLRDVIALDRAANTTPEMLCFGLLEQFDIPQLKALAKTVQEK